MRPASRTPAGAAPPPSSCANAVELLGDRLHPQIRGDGARGGDQLVRTLAVARLTAARKQCRVIETHAHVHRWSVHARCRCTRRFEVRLRAVALIARRGENAEEALNRSREDRLRRGHVAVGEWAQQLVQLRGAVIVSQLGA